LFNSILQNYEKKSNGYVFSVKKIACENFDGYEIDIFIGVGLRLFSFRERTSTGSDCDVEGEKDTFFQGDFRVETTDITGFLL